jgi:hypothetical protein
MSDAIGFYDVNPVLDPDTMPQSTSDPYNAPPDDSMMPATESYDANTPDVGASILPGQQQLPFLPTGVVGAQLAAYVRGGAGGWAAGTGSDPGGGQALAYNPRTNVALQSDGSGGFYVTRRASPLQVALMQAAAFIGKQVTVAVLKALLKKLGSDGFTRATGLPVQAQAVLLTAKTHRRGRGISYRQIRTARRVHKQLNKMHRELNAGFHHFAAASGKRRR